MFGAIAPRSAALQARATPGRARAAAVDTFVIRAWASVLRTTPRCRVPSRARSSTNRPWPVSRRWSSFRRGELPIMALAIYHARRSPKNAHLLLGAFFGDLLRRPALLDLRRMADVQRVFGKLTLIQLLGNLVGALLTWFYFRFVDFTAPQFQARISRAEILFNVVSFAALIAAGIIWGSRWARPLDGSDPAASADSELVRRRAIMVPYVFGALAFAGWIGAGLIWGVLYPVIWGFFTPERSMRSLFGITGVAGSVTAALVFFAVEHQWRHALPAFFPGGDLSAVAGVLRLRVRVRLLVIFVMLSVIPLSLLGVLTYTRAARRRAGRGAADRRGHAGLHRVHRGGGRARGDRALALRRRKRRRPARPGPERHARGRAGRARHALPGREQRRDRRGGRGLQSYGRGSPGSRVPEGDVRQVREPGDPRRDPGRPCLARGAGAGGHDPVRGPPRLHAVGRGHRAARGRKRPERLLHRDGR